MKRLSMTGPKNFKKRTLLKQLTLLSSLAGLSVSPLHAEQKELADVLSEECEGCKKCQKFEASQAKPASNAKSTASTSAAKLSDLEAAAARNGKGRVGKKSVEPDLNQGLTIQLISEVESIKPGQPFRLGIKITHEEKFHTYWKNPGIVGVPTFLEWKLPKGFKASEMQWPNPEQSLMAGIPCYGYERDVLLMFTITPPNEIKNQSVILGGDARWMCCAANCFPGFDTLALSLPIGNGAFNKAHQAIFKKAETELPQVGKHLSAKLLSKADAAEIKVKIVSSKPTKPIHVFNKDKQTSPDIKYSLIPLKGEKNSWIYTAERSEFSPKNTTSFPFILQTAEGFFKVEAK